MDTEIIGGVMIALIFLVFIKGIIQAKKERK